jgi:hypothetical protein
MLEIVPKLRNLRSLNLSNNNIEFFLPIMNIIKNEASFLPSTSLRVLDIHNNPVFKKIKEDPDEKAAVLSLLGTFSGISNLGGYHKSDYDSDIEYALRINHAGRRIVVKAAIDGSGGNDAGKAVVPISLWPTILERAYEKSSVDIYYNPFINKEAMKKNATGIYYLLREVGPALLLAGQRRTDVCIISKDIVNDDKDDDDDSGGSGEAKTNNKSLKRKDIIMSNDRFTLETRNNKDQASSLSSPSPSPSPSTKRFCHG